jgi:hypothetical protein
MLTTQSPEKSRRVTAVETKATASTLGGFTTDSGAADILQSPDDPGDSRPLSTLQVMSEFLPHKRLRRSRRSASMEVVTILAVQVATVVTIAVANRTNTSHGFARLDCEAQSDASVKAPSFPHLAEAHRSSDTMWT